MGGRRNLGGVSPLTPRRRERIFRVEDYDPQLRRIARLLPPVPVNKHLLRAMRRTEKLFIARLPAPRRVSVERVNANVTVRVYHPDHVTGPALLWMHGGGYIFGTAWQDDALCLRMCRKLGALVASVEYRRPPEHPYPAALDDCAAALAWLAAQPGVDPQRIAIGGASAGGGLCAALALRTRDEGALNVAGQLLVYPMLDDRTALRRETRGHHRITDHRGIGYCWAAYLGRPPGGRHVPAYAAAARADDLAGLPPAWIGVGARDLFHDEDIAYAKRLVDAGVPCDIEVVPGAFHGFDQLAPLDGDRRRVRERAGACDDRLPGRGHGVSSR